MNKLTKLSLLIIVLMGFCQVVQSSSFDFTNPPTEANDPLTEIENTEGRLQELADFVNLAIPAVLPEPSNGAASQALIINNGGTGYTTARIINITGDSSNGISLLYNGLAARAAIVASSDGSSLEFKNVIRSDQGDITFNDTPTSGQYLRFATPATIEAVSLGTSSRWELKTSRFATADGGKYIVASGVTIIDVHDPAAGDEFWIKPEIGFNLVSNDIDLNGSMQVAGTSAASYNLDDNVIFHFVADGNGDNYDVGGTLLDR